MTTAEQNLQRAQKLLDTANEGYAPTKEVAGALAAIVKSLTDLRKQVTKEMMDSHGSMDSKVKSCLKKIDEVESKFKDMVINLDSATDEAVHRLTTKLSKEIQRVEQLIPGQTDLSDIEQKLTDLETKVATPIEFPTLEATELRDKLEELNGDERLDKSAIKGLEEWLEKNVSTGGSPKQAMSRGTYLYIDGAKKGLINTLNFASGNGMTLAYSKVDGLDTLTFTSSGSSSGGGTLNKQLVSGVINGSNTVFTIPTAFVGKSIIILDSQAFVQDLDFTVSDTTITYLTAPAADHIAANHYLISGGSLEAASWTFNATPTGTVDGSNTVFTLPETPLQAVVYADGARMKSGVDYNLSGATITFVALRQPFTSISVDYLV